LHRRRRFSGIWPDFCIAAAPRIAIAETEDERARLFAALKNAKTEREGRQAEHEIWQWWLAKAPNA
jgi:hypothetical protein